MVVRDAGGGVVRVVDRQHAVPPRAQGEGVLESPTARPRCGVEDARWHVRVSLCGVRGGGMMQDCVASRPPPRSNPSGCRPTGRTLEYC